MHKKAMEMAKHAMEDACAKGYDCMTSQDWDNFKDCVETAEKMIKAEYYYLIVEEMKEYKEEEEAEEKHMIKMLKEEHGMSDDESKRYYDMWRYKSGRFAPKGHGTRRGYVEPPYYHMMPDMYEHDPEYWRDMDRKDGKMYYTETMPHHTADMSKSGSMQDMKPESRFDKAKRGYTEAKDIHKGNTPEDKQITMREAEKFTNIAIDELMEALEDASPEVKNMVKTKVMSKMQKMQ